MPGSLILPQNILHRCDIKELDRRALSAFIWSDCRWSISSCKEWPNHAKALVHAECIMSLFEDPGLRWCLSGARAAWVMGKIIVLELVSGK
jgi:hypothetical protein